MRSIDIDLDVHRAIEGARESFAERENSILRRLLGIDRSSVPAKPRQRSPRSSGAYSTKVGETTVEANSLKELLRRCILVADRKRPGTVERLSLVPTPKGRYIVARQATGLYPKSPQLAEFAEKLDDTWWYDGNVGKNQVQAYLRKLSEIAHLASVPRISKRNEKTMVTLADLGLG